jgi:excisionase family DNA binding protein
MNCAAKFEGANFAAAGTRSSAPAAQAEARPQLIVFVFVPTQDVAKSLTHQAFDLIAIDAMAIDWRRLTGRKLAICHAYYPSSIDGGKAMTVGTAQIAISIDEAARQANMCRDKIYDAIRKDQLKAKKAGRRTLIMADELRRYLDSLPSLKLGE